MPEMPKKIPMFPVESSNITEIGYNASIRTMRIGFKQGTYYDYFDVPPELFKGLLSAQSVGKFFSANVRSQYKGNKVEEPNGRIS